MQQEQRSQFQVYHRLHLICLQAIWCLFSLGKFVLLSTASVPRALQSTLAISTCETLTYSSHLAADGTSAAPRSWLHWGIVEDKLHLLNCTRERTNTDKVWQLRGFQHVLQWQTQGTASFISEISWSQATVWLGPFTVSRQNRSLSNDVINIQGLILLLKAGQRP